MIFKLIRWPLGRLILLTDFLTRPKPPARPEPVQQRIDDAMAPLAMYQFHACPFCVKTRRAIRRLGLNIELRDARNDARWRDALEQGGGRIQVPCLYIPDNPPGEQWMYESDDIIAYLEQRVSALSEPAHA